MTKQQTENFMPGERYRCQIFDISTVIIINGKMKDFDAYAISLCYEDKRKLINIRNILGNPIRQYELEWGKYTGQGYEFIVSKDMLKEKLNW